jgi:hypothetical protein
MRRFMIALICAIVLPVVIISGWGLKWAWGMHQHENRVKACFAQFKRNTPEDWAAAAQVCQAYWDVARRNEAAGAQQPPLPPSLASLHPVYWFVHEDQLYVSWTGGFDNEVLALDYHTTPGSRTLWLVSSRADREETAVWSELHPAPEKRDAVKEP